MPTFLKSAKSENVLDVGADRVVDETSDERFDRAAFARRALELVQPPRMTVAICEGAARMRVESGRLWGRPRTSRCDGEGGPVEKWALLAIPAQASRRAIALAVAQLASEPPAYALDVLMGEAGAAREPVEESPATADEPTAA
jgi:hypothetical protein